MHPELRGNGIGTSLVVRALEVMKNEGYKSVFLWVVRENQRAIKLYERLGFRNSEIEKLDSSHSGKPITEVRYDTHLT